MKKTLKTFALLTTGIALGVAAGWQMSALANKKTILPLNELEEFSTVYSIIKESYVEPVEDKQLVTSAISGMVSALDPHSTYMDEKTLKNFMESTQGRFVGLGIEISMEDGLVKVISPIEDTPAYRAGIQSNDLISRIDQTPVKD